MDSQSNNNRKLLDEVNAARSWFRAQKTRPIRVREAKRKQQIQTLEGIETVSKGDYICKGEKDELWPQSKSSLFSKYQPTGEVKVRKKLRWETFTPRPDNQGVMAAKVDHPFKVYATWGVLSGKAGDYVVKNFSSKDTKYPEDLWIVDASIFCATYEAK